MNYYDDLLPLGLMLTPIFTSRRENYERFTSLYNWIGIDNGCYSRPEAFNLKSYLGMISRVVATTDRIFFATAPDVFDLKEGKGNWPSTLRKSLPVLPLIRKAGAPAAIVLQDGATPETVPWEEIDAIFIGASTQWKLSQACRTICIEARLQRKWIHMGRVNSLGRMKIAYRFGCHSVDGNYLLHKRDGVLDIVGWMHAIWATDKAMNPDINGRYFDGCAV